MPQSKCRKKYREREIAKRHKTIHSTLNPNVSKDEGKKRKIWEKKKIK
jgi:hypothetical protein